MKITKLLLSETKLVLQEDGRIDNGVIFVSKKDLLKAVIPLLQEISDSEETDRMFSSDIDGTISYLKTL